MLLSILFSCCGHNHGSEALSGAIGHVKQGLITDESSLFLMIFVSVICALSSSPLGLFMVLRRHALMADALSHGLFPGMALGSVLFSGSFMLVTLCGILGALSMLIGTLTLTRRSVLPQDTLFAGISLGGMAVGMICLHRQADILPMVSGALEDTTWLHVFFCLVVACFTGLFFSFKAKKLILRSFDPEFFYLRQGSGQGLEILFWGIVSLNLVVSSYVLGTLMALGMMILPTLSARVWGNNIKTMAWISGFISTFACIIGVFIAHFYRYPIGPTIILLLLGIFLVTLLYEVSVKVRYEPKNFKKNMPEQE